MALDPNARAWQRLARQLAPELPGEWVVRRSGIRSVIIRLPVDWVVTYVLANRSRRSQDPVIWVGQRPLAYLWKRGFGLNRGVTSDRPTGPGGYDLTSPSAAEAVLTFIREAGLPSVEWTAHDFAERAERQFVEPEADRGRPLFYQQAAAWRVILDQGSPLPPALDAAAWFENSFAPEDAAWLRSLIDAWNTGGRPSALAFLERNRAEFLADLDLPITPPAVP